MSSKSKRGNKPPRRPSDPHAAHVAAVEAQASAASEHHDPLEDFIEVPKGRSVWMQLFLIGLLILLLIIFIVPGALMSLASGEQDVPAMVWEHPSEGTIEMTYPEFTQEKRRFQFLVNDSADDTQVAATLIYDAVAKDAGIEISDEELYKQLDSLVQQQFGGDVELYRQVMAARQPGGAPGFEKAIRRSMRAQRWQTLLGQLATVADPAEIEELWAEQHKEYRFHYVELPVEDVREAAGAEVPEDELQAWFDGLQEWEKSSYKTAERYAAELAYFPVGTEVPAALLERYPEPEDVDPDQRAQDYYNRVFFSRFLRPEPEDGEEPTGDTYLSFEEVKDTAKAEAPVFYALQRWLDDVSERSKAEGAEPIDLEAEASELGLAFLGQDDPLAAEDWTGLENLGGVRLASSMRRTLPGDWIVGVTAESGALMVGRVTEKVEATLPPFEEIRDQVAEAWVDDRATDLAVEKLAELREGLMAARADVETSVVDEAAFVAAAEAAGFTVGTRDWLDRAGAPTDDPDAQEPAHAFIRSRVQLYDLEEGELSEPALDGRREHAYLVQAAGARKVDVAKMRPQDFRTLSMRSAANARMAFTSALATDELERVYGLRWPSREQSEAASADDDMTSEDDEYSE